MGTISEYSCPHSDQSFSKWDCPSKRGHKDVKNAEVTEDQSTEVKDTSSSSTSSSTSSNSKTEREWSCDTCFLKMRVQKKAAVWHQIISPKCESFDSLAKEETASHSPTSNDRNQLNRQNSSNQSHLLTFNSNQDLPKTNIKESDKDELRRRRKDVRKLMSKR